MTPVRVRRTSYCHPPVLSTYICPIAFQGRLHSIQSQLINAQRSGEGISSSGPSGSLMSSYLLLNMSMNLANKYVLGVHGFRFPVLLTISHMAFSCLLLAPIMAMKVHRIQHKAMLIQQWKRIVAIAGLMSASIALNNASLVRMSLTLNQIIRQVPFCINMYWPGQSFVCTADALMLYLQDVNLHVH